MSRDEALQKMLSAGPGPSLRWMLVFALLAVIGCVAFLVALWTTPDRAWQAFHINFVFWTGMAFGSVLLSAILDVCKAHWGRPVKRLAEAPGAFLPVAFVLFWLLYIGRNAIFPWIHEPVPMKAAWLNVPSLFIRDGAVLFILTAVAVALLYNSIRRDTEAIADGSIRTIATDRWHRRGRNLAILAPLYAVLFAFLLTIIGIDLVMSLNPHWFSTLFGAYFFIGSFYAGLSVLMILMVLAVKSMGMAEFVRPVQFHDVGKMMLGFCLMTGDFFYVQYFVMWYGNLPEETMYVIERMRIEPWRPLAPIVLVVCFGIPFLVLLSRKIKMKPMAMLVLSLVILGGMWLERFTLIAPSMWEADNLPLGWTEAAVTLGFLGLVGLCILGFLKRFPVFAVSDPLLWKSLEK